MGFGEYPKEYNRAVHGPYDPARYYGKPDTPFGQLKLSEIGDWFSRRNKSPQAIVNAVSRAHWRWQHKYIHPRKATMAPYFQLTVAGIVIFYIFNYGRIRHEKQAKYH